MLKQKAVVLTFLLLFLVFNLPSIVLAQNAVQRPKSPLLEEAPKAVLAHVVVHFRSKEYSGQWGGWNRLTEFNARTFPDWKKYQHDPDKADANGRADIPSVYYPLVGLYDMTDPAAVEYQCQEAKMAGIDGFIFDLWLYDESGPDNERWKPDCMRLYVKIMKRYDLYAVLDYEDSSRFEQLDEQGKSREEVVPVVYSDINAWLNLFTDVQYCIGKRPLLVIWFYERPFTGKGGGIVRLSPSEIKAWKNQFPIDSRPVIVNQWLQKEYIGAIDGELDWMYLVPALPQMAPFVLYSDFELTKKRREEKAAQMRELLKSGSIDFVMPGIWPEFNDIKVWGWGAGPKFMPSMNGQIYRYLWEKAIEEKYPVVHIATWNGWFEGHCIEPSVEKGTKYIEMTREYSSKFKKIAPTRGNLMVPVWIYKVRKMNEEAAANDMVRASELVRNGSYDEAERIVKPWAEKLHVDAVKYWK